MKQTSYRQIKQIGEQVNADYITLEEATLATGFPKVRLLQWCAEQHIRHSKRKNRWLVHKADLVAALSRDGAGSGS